MFHSIVDLLLKTCSWVFFYLSCNTDYFICWLKTAWITCLYFCIGCTLLLSRWGHKWGERLKSGWTYKRQFTVFYVNNSHGHGYLPCYYWGGGSRGGARGRGGGYFQTVLMPDGPKKNFGDWPSPSSQGLDDRPPYLKLWIRHCIDHSRKYHNIPWALSLVSLGPKKNWKQCLYKILEWPTKSIMVCYGIFWNSQLYSQQSPEFSCKPSPGELTW